MSDTVTVTVETTRNADSVIFVLKKTLLPPGVGNPYPNREIAQSHPLAKALFEIQGVASVWIIASEIQVTKDAQATWGALKSKIVETIKRIES